MTGSETFWIPREILDKNYIRIVRMLIERTNYYAKPGLSEKVLALRHRASELRLELGLPAGTVWQRQDEGPGPDVHWQCCFESLEAQQASVRKCKR